MIAPRNCHVFNLHCNYSKLFLLQSSFNNLCFQCLIPFLVFKTKYCNIDLHYKTVVKELKLIITTKYWIMIAYSDNKVMTQYTDSRSLTLLGAYIQTILPSFSSQRLKKNPTLTKNQIRFKIKNPPKKILNMRLIIKSDKIYGLKCCKDSKTVKIEIRHTVHDL